MMRFASLVMMLLVAVPWGNAQAEADKGLQLNARATKVINGFETELRGDYREQNGPSRLNIQLEKINLPIGTPVAFCVSHAGVSTIVGIGKVAKKGGSPTATIELEATDGDAVPKVNANDVLQERQRPVAPFNPNPTCGAALLLSAPFLQ
jgi:hypothetical protein